MAEKPKGLKLITSLAGFLLDVSVWNNSFWLFNNFSGNEDQFWFLYAGKNFNWYKLHRLKKRSNLVLKCSLNVYLNSINISYLLAAISGGNLGSISGCLILKSLGTKF